MQTLREKCPITEFFLVCIFLYSDWIWKITSPNTGKYGPEKTPHLDTFHAVKYEARLIFTSDFSGYGLYKITIRFKIVTL